MNRSLPAQPNIDHLKREAKSLLKSRDDGNTCELLRHLHRFSDATDDEIRSASVSLTDIQFALAMDYGFVSWQALRNHVLDAQVSPDSVADYVRDILIDALKSGSSDVHFEPMESACRVRFRTDGMLRDVEQKPTDLGPRISRRLKELAGLDTSDTNTPQDGRFTFNITKTKAIEFRVSTVPVVLGEKITCRIIDPETPKVPLDQLGYEPDQLTLLKEAINETKGMILFAGPVGSGKTVGQYTTLKNLDSAQLNISTVEDPVEVLIDGFNQCAVNRASGMDHAGALTSILSTDPEVVMVSELPDLATAKIAFKAAHRGNFIISSLETNSAPETLTYLNRLGISPYELSSSTNVIVAQRLARRLCPHCRASLQITALQLANEGFPEAEFEGAAEVFSAVGCEKCFDGYRGRIGLFEVIKMTDKISKAIMSGCDAYEIADACQQEGYRNLVQSGLRRVLDGTTSLEELRRVTGR